jgi:hypothetical protein
VGFDGGKRKMMSEKRKRMTEMEKMMTMAVEPDWERMGEIWRGQERFEEVWRNV